MVYNSGGSRNLGTGEQEGWGWAQFTVECWEGGAVLKPLVQGELSGNNLLFLLQAALRKQDVKLLKQLIHISEVIQTFYQKVNKNSKSTTDISPDSGMEVSVTDIPQTRRMPLVRQQSVPNYCRINHSGSLLSSATSSFDGISFKSLFYYYMY